MDSDEFGESTSDLDSHANMCVFGKNSIMVLTTGRIVNVNALADEVGGLNKVSIVDVIVAYDCLR